MPNHQDAWRTTEHLLATAKALFPPQVAVANQAQLQQFDDFLEANELGLAFEYRTLEQPQAGLTTCF